MSERKWLLDGTLHPKHTPTHHKPIERGRPRKRAPVTAGGSKSEMCPLCRRQREWVPVNVPIDRQPWHCLPPADWYPPFGWQSPLRIHESDPHALQDAVAGAIWNGSTEEVAYCGSRPVLGDGQSSLRVGRPTDDRCNTVSRLNGQVAAYRRRTKQGKRSRQERATLSVRIDRVAIYQRDLGVCHVCGKSVDPTQFHLDHVVPISRGGTHTPDNVRVAHPHCNLRKAARLLDAQFVWSEYVVARKELWRRIREAGYCRPASDYPIPPSLTRYASPNTFPELAQILGYPDARALHEELARFHRQDKPSIPIGPQLQSEDDSAERRGTHQ